MLLQIYNSVENNNATETWLIFNIIYTFLIFK